MWVAMRGWHFGEEAVGGFSQVWRNFGCFHWVLSGHFAGWWYWEEKATLAAAEYIRIPEFPEGCIPVEEIPEVVGEARAEMWYLLGARTM